MRKIRIKLEYGCFPVWIYDENNRIVDNDLPESLENTDVDSMFLSIQDRYDSLYLDNEKEFKYIGFKTTRESEQFFADLATAIKLLKDRLGDEYVVENNMDVLESRIGVR